MTILKLNQQGKPSSSIVLLLTHLNNPPYVIKTQEKYRRIETHYNNKTLLQSREHMIYFSYLNGTARHMSLEDMKEESMFKCDRELVFENSRPV